MTDPIDQERWRAIERVLDGALDLPPEQRSAFLDEACGSDAALRAEVESLLAAHAETDDYLEQPVASLHAALGDPYRAGQRIGPYRLLREIGRGGLGVVFLAADTRLGREVALKLLPAWRTADPHARARFEREATTAAALDHPGICTVYEIGQPETADPYIAMAYVEGESLKDRIGRGPLPLGTAVDIGIQIARALAHAHERGIVHRDVKPPNVMITPEGQVRLVDFGIAKLRDAGTTLTRAGETPGTIAYMSPEQIRGERVDHRADVWATGVVLYEMITGRRPFDGEDEQARSHAILHRDPEPLTALRTGVPLSLDRIVAKALAKDPAQRYQHMEELPVDLGAALEQPARLASPSAGRLRGFLITTRGRLILGGLLTLVLLAAIAFLARRPASEVGPPLHLSILLPPGQELSTETFRRFAISPDGLDIVYMAGTGGPTSTASPGSCAATQLYHRSLGSGETPRPIPGTEGAADPFFSPDGRWVGFFADEELRKVSLEGGAPQKITEAPTMTSRGAAWGSDGTIILPLGQTSGLFRVSENGGLPDTLTIPQDERGRAVHFFPQILPDGESVLFTIWRPDESVLGAAILDVETGEWAEIATGCVGARYVPTGHIVCAEVEGVLETGNYLAAPYTPGRHTLEGPFVSIPALGFGGYDFAISGTGTLLYATDARPSRRITWVDRQGRITPLGDDFDRASALALSPDGSRVAIARVVEAGRVQLWLYDPEDGTAARLTDRSSINNLPLWSPDGERILFNSLQPPAGIYEIRPDRGDTATLLLRRRGNILVPGSVSSDGRFLVYAELHPRTLGDIWLLSLEDGSDTPLVRTPHDERMPTLSPDDRWLAYTSDESGRDEIWVRPFPGPGPPIRVSSGGGQGPRWSRDGTELFFMRCGTMMAVPVRTDPTFSAGPAVRLFDGPYEGEYIGARNYDVGPDGRFLMVQAEPTGPRNRLDVVLNWFDELERLAPQAGTRR